MRYFSLEYMARRLLYSLPYGFWIQLASCSLNNRVLKQSGVMWTPQFNSKNLTKLNKPLNIGGSILKSKSPSTRRN
jgi:hypothetical protein